MGRLESLSRDAPIRAGDDRATQEVFMKVIAITGGGQGIGRGIAYHFALLG
jgi:hypothetical protein